MFIPFFILLSSVAMALQPLRPGELYISEIYGIAVHMNIGIVDEKVAVKAGPTSFEYGMNGSLKVANTETYIGFNYMGELALYDEPQFGFSLQNKPGMKFTRTVFFRNSSIFGLCGNGSVRYDTNCRDAQSISITYEDILHPYGKPKMIGWIK
ncbi:hypothetical protein OXX79_012329 [Metschnikowia pulcherrima]